MDKTVSIVPTLSLILAGQITILLAESQLVPVISPDELPGPTPVTSPIPGLHFKATHRQVLAPMARRWWQYTRFEGSQSHWDTPTSSRFIQFSRIFHHEPSVFDPFWGSPVVGNPKNQELTSPLNFWDDYKNGPPTGCHSRIWMVQSPLKHQMFDAWSSLQQPISKVCFTWIGDPGSPGKKTCPKKNYF